MYLTRVYTSARSFSLISDGTSLPAQIFTQNLFAESIIQWAQQSHNKFKDRRIQVAESDVALSGEIVPGRPVLRPHVRLVNPKSKATDDDDLCAKSYRRRNSHSPGIFTVQCVCRHPKVIGVSVILSKKSTATVLSTLLCRFPVLPRCVFYDNACNLARTSILRFPSILNTSQFLCDRFH